MAIVQNFWLQGASKRLAGAVIYNAMGQTRQRRLSTSVSNPRTEAQMNQRIRWANAVSFYRANSSWMKYAFETKKTNQSEYNKFMSINVTTSPIALTKQAAAAGACVVAPYIITQGSLPSIEWQDAGTSVKSNIFLGSGKTFDQYTTVGEFASDLILYNPALREGDQISLIRFSQLTNASTGHPYVIVRKYEVLLKSDSTALLSDYLPSDYLLAPGLSENNAIFVNKEDRQGGFAMILSRTIAGKTYVSTQSIVIVNNETLIAQYSSSAAIAAAIQSYGESEEAFLSTVSASAATIAPIVNTINYMTFGGATYEPSAKTPNGSSLNSGQLTLYFSSPVSYTDAPSVKAVMLESGSNYNGVNVLPSANTIKFEFSGAILHEDYDNHIKEIVVTIDGVDTTIRFAPLSAYSQEGME